MIEEVMTAREKMEFLAWSSCLVALMIIALCLFPGVTEIWSKLRRLTRRSNNRRHRAGHRVQEDQARRDPDGDQVEDTQRIEASA